MNGEWQECACGREFWREAFHPTALRFKVPCRVCENDIHIAEDLCPQSVPVVGGFSACRLGYRHRGQCVPWVTNADLMAHIAATEEVTP